MKVTVFKKANEPKGGVVTDVATVFDSMRTGGKLKDVILDISETEDKKERSAKKLNNLPVICFNGEFTYRNIPSFIKHNGLIILDIDELEDVEAMKKEICELPYVLACFISPSYKGIKFIVSIPEINVSELGTDEADFVFKEYFEALSQDIKGIDNSGKDTSRACFFSYDPDIYINFNAETYTKRVKVDRPENYTENVEIPNITGSETWALNILEKKVSDSTDGSRHVELFSASRLAGGYISGGVVEMSEAEAVLQSAFARTPFDKNYDYKKTIRDGIKNGLHYPVYGDHKYDKVNKKTELEYETHPQRILDSVEDKGIKTASDLMYVPFSEFKEEALDLHENGSPKGWDCRFPSGREYMSYRENWTTFIYSAPHSGKTQFAISELVYLAERYGKKIAVYSKELGTPSDVLAEVSSTYIGKLFYTHDKKDPRKMTKAEMKKSFDFFEKHFHVIDPHYKGNDIDVTVDAIFDAVTSTEVKFGIKFDICYIDPLSEVDEGGEDRIDRFVKYVNAKVIKDAKLNNRHNILVSHVRDQQPITDKSSGFSWFPVPTAREVSGGQNSFKQGNQMICVYRPSPHVMDSQTQTEYLENETHVHIQKSRPKGCGHLGMYKLFFDRNTNRYYETPDMGHYPSVEQDKMQDKIDEGDKNQVEIFNPNILTPPDETEEPF